VGLGSGHPREYIRIPEGVLIDPHPMVELKDRFLSSVIIYGLGQGVKGGLMSIKNQDDATRKRYNRLSFIYNLIETPMEYFISKRSRIRLENKIKDQEGQVLEVGVGTGKNIPYYPPGIKITAIDFSPKMLKRARKKSIKLGSHVNLLEMDVQDLAFPNDHFDKVFATFVFCSVPDPVKGLKELKRVCKPNGKLILLEHMRPENPVLGFIFDVLNPVVVRIFGANINRRTKDNIISAGWNITFEENLVSDIVRWVEAEP
jgi:ubiquinone/menaquinone biosynthesis C-methylase UbiE